MNRSNMKAFRCLSSGVALALAALPACRKAEVRGVDPRPVRVTTVAASGASAAVRLSASIQPGAEVALAFKSAGYVERLATRAGPAGKDRWLAPGDLVRAGEELAAQRASDFDDQVRSAAGQVAQARAALERAEYDLNRAERLKAAASITGSQFEAQRSAREAAGGALQSAAATLAMAEQSRRDSVLRAPFDAVVVRRLVDVGELGRPGVPALLLADLTQVKALVGISDRMLPLLRVGDAVVLRADALHREFAGRVTSVAPAADPQSRLFPVEILAANPDGALRPGMVVTASPSAAGSDRAGVVVPLAALRQSRQEGADFAVVLVVQGTARERKVVVGGVEGNAIVVTEGLITGESVVTHGLAGLRDGDPVVVLP